MRLKRASGTAGRPSLIVLLCVVVLGPAENAVQVRAAHWTLGLGHPGALVVDVHFARGLALCFAFHAVELAAVRLRHDFSLFDVPPHLVAAAGPRAGASDRLAATFEGATVTATNAIPL